MNSRLSRLALLTIVLATASSAFAAECGWLATSELDRRFPELAPWRVTAGGAVGRCQFLSRPGPPNMFSANQLIQGSAEEAAKTVADLRAETAKRAETRDLPQLGERGFSYASGPRTVNLIGHRGRVVVIALASLQSSVGDAELASLVELAKAALAVADDPAALEAGTRCPWLDAATLPKLLPAGGITQQVFGENSCMAKDTANAILLVSVTQASPAMLGRRDANCSWEEVAELGPDAAIGRGCTSGVPRATLRMTIGGELVEYNLTPGSEPSEGQRRALVELAKAVRAGLAN